MNQKEMELAYSNKHGLDIYKSIMGKNTDLFAPLTEIMKHYLGQTFDYSYTVADGTSKTREDMIEAHAVLRELAFDKIFKKLFVMAWQAGERGVTIQQVASVIKGFLPEMSKYGRHFTAIEPVMTAFASSQYIRYDANFEDTAMFTCLLPQITEITEDQSKRGYTLPLIERPLHVADNDHCGYHSIRSGVILGGKLKHHTYPVRLSHINTLNSIAYEYEPRLAELTEPVFDLKYKVKKNGEIEEDADVIQRYVSFRDIHDKLPERLSHIKDNVFYHVHAFDTRGRFYPKAYEFNYQGGKYLRCIQQFARKEIINPEF